MIRNKFIVGAVVFLLSGVVGVFAKEFASGHVLDAKFYHLGDETKNWPEASAKPTSTRLDVRFQASPNEKEMTLGISYRDVNDVWKLELNGKKIATLTPNNLMQRFYFSVAPQGLKAGENLLSIIPDEPTDDMVIGKISLYEGNFRDLLKLQPVVLSVKDEASGKQLPARITITDPAGALQEILLAPTNGTAVRQGLIYMAGKETRIELSHGEYIIYATRGMEWSLAEKKISVKPSSTNIVELTLRREVDTTGFISCDTHIHTLTFSGHGDSTIDERMATLAGEGVEMAVATDHNHHTDYRPYQKRLGLNEYFTPVIGNEVTTKNGHLNGFPMKGEIPNYKETNWVTLVNDIRTKGAKVVVLNHPRWPDVEQNPFNKFGLNRASGSRATGPKFTFDGMELANSCSLLTNSLYLFEDWFALLNHGEKIKAVGSSDTHNVGNPVGQGRTYIRSSTDDAAKINIDEACKKFLKGDTSISMGIFADVVVNQKYKMGDTVPVKNAPVEINLRVAAPSWVKPQRAILFLNGKIVAEQKIEIEASKPTNHRLKFSLPAPGYDSYLVCVVLGDGINAPYWPTEENYTLAATNPVFLDADNNGKYRSPRETAQRLLKDAGKDLESQWPAVMANDDVISIQMIDLLLQTNNDKSGLLERIRQASRPAFKEYLSYQK